MKKIKLISLFAGIGAMEFGAKKIYDEVEIVAAAEIDKYARISYLANHEIDENKFYSDVKLLDGKDYKDKYDCLCFGFPCQDYSIAGLRAGLDGQKGTLFYEAARILKDSMPEMFIAENVKGLLSSNKGKDFKVILEILRDIGYNIHYEVLNTKDYGVPQNRERIFLVGFKDKEHYYNFSFAPKMKLEKRLKDILEDNVDEKYYLSDKMIECLDKRVEIAKGYEFKPQIGDKVANCLTVKYGNYSTDTYIKDQILQQVGTLDIKGNDSIERVYSSDGISPCLTTIGGGNREPKIITCNNNLEEIENTPSIGQAARIYRNDGLSPTLNCGWTPLSNQDYRIRKLTPRECFRLQDFPDSFKFVVSNSQLYKQAGNSISVNVMEMIFKQIEKSRYCNTNGGLF